MKGGITSTREEKNDTGLRGKKTNNDKIGALGVSVTWGDKNLVEVEPSWDCPSSIL